VPRREFGFANGISDESGLCFVAQAGHRERRPFSMGLQRILHSLDDVLAALFVRQGEVSAEHRLLTYIKDNAQLQTFEFDIPVQSNGIRHLDATGGYPVCARRTRLLRTEK
jgi:hypothetical protein